jgi:hypothetical protein
MPAGQRRKQFQEYLDTAILGALPILPYDERAAAWHGRERARLEALGKTPSFADGQIAAIAVVTLCRGKSPQLLGRSSPGYSLSTGQCPGI